ncbi:MAG: cytochrome c biogenesis protein ResB [Candidatus Eiseniibacteriota bacterium]|nr:MAG: cytochrome c biogenesis protein ResB [Candidatus Eisenbacteria bacterium]
MEMNLPQEGTPSNEKQGSIWMSVYSFLSSAKFGLFLLLTVGCVSLLGMFVLQNAPQEQYLSRYGEFWGRFILSSGLGSVYRVWWYLLLICLTCVNLVLCSLKRVKFSFSQAFSRPLAEDHGLLRTARTAEVPLEVSNLNDLIGKRLRAKGFSVNSSEVGQAKLTVGQKGGVSRIGFLVTHLAVILVLVAGIVNGTMGYRIQRPLNMGESFDLNEIKPGAGFSIRADDFVIETTEDGKIRDYKSTLTVLDGEREVLTKVIEVNHPLTYNGISFYQASYGEDPTKVKEARIVFAGEEGTRTIIDLPFRVRKQIPDTEVEAEVTDYVPHFVKDLATGEVRSRSLEPRLPAIRLEVSRGGAVVAAGWLVKGMDVHSGSGELGRFHFFDYYPAFYTGIDVAANPGVALMFTGFGIASIGIFLSFFVPYKKIWVKVLETGKGRSELRMAGVSRKDPFTLKREIDGLYKFAATAETRGKGEGSARE